MSDPNPLQYQGRSAANTDASHLRILSILHYIWGGLIAVFSTLFIIHIVLSRNSVRTLYKTPSIV